MAKEPFDYIKAALIGLLAIFLMVTTGGVSMLLARTDLTQLAYWVWTSIFH